MLACHRPVLPLRRAEAGTVASAVRLTGFAGGSNATTVTTLRVLTPGATVPGGVPCRGGAGRSLRVGAKVDPARPPDRSRCCGLASGRPEAGLGRLATPHHPALGPVRRPTDRADPRPRR